MELKNKKVLLMGLGILGGGLSTAKWLLKRGADLTITDTKNEKELKVSLDTLSDFKNINFVLGQHKEQDFLDNEIIVINPGVSINNKFVQFAKKNGKQIENELTLFYRYCKSRNIVAITGTRGKTTTTNWVYHILKSKYSDTVLAGNSATNPFLHMIDKCEESTPVVIEVPSFHLELIGEENVRYSPKIAVVTNIYQDHLNRHRTLENYARTKANIFKNQEATDFLILNKNNKWTDFLLSLKPKAKVIYFPEDDFEKSDFVNKKDFIEKWGEHNFLNLEASVLVATTMGISKEVIKEAIPTLPQIKFRQEEVYKDEKLTVYNDTAATSPEATVAAVNRFKGKKNLILITGGTDKDLDFSDWVIAIKKDINMENLVLLSGSATEKMKGFLSENSYNEFGTLSECLEYALKRAEEESVILFSPSSKSFEKFKNEFDRGEQFNKLINQLLK